jgi:hypothetical protein
MNNMSISDKAVRLEAPFRDATVARSAASHGDRFSIRKQAGYMVAPERFAETSDSSCSAGAVASVSAV